MANVFTAGIDDSAPMAKQKISEELVRSMLGPTLAIVAPMRSSKLRSLFLRKLNCERGASTVKIDVHWLPHVGLYQDEDIVHANSQY